MSRISLTPLVLPANPTNPLEAATKQYVDGLAAGPGAWQAMTPLTSPWVAGTNAPRYRLEGTVVRLDGIVQRPSGSVTGIFTLPSGFRPVAAHAFAVSATNAFGRIVVAAAASGAITFTTGVATGDVNLDGITFPTT